MKNQGEEKEIKETLNDPDFAKFSEDLDAENQVIEKTRELVQSEFDVTGSFAPKFFILLNDQKTDADGKKIKFVIVASVPPDDEGKMSSSSFKELFADLMLMMLKEKKDPQMIIFASPGEMITKNKGEKEERGFGVSMVAIDTNNLHKGIIMQEREINGKKQLLASCDKGLEILHKWALLTPDLEGIKDMDSGKTAEVRLGPAAMFWKIWRGLKKAVEDNEI